MVAPGTGVLLNNQMDDFALRPGMPNAFGVMGFAANAAASVKGLLSSSGSAWGNLQTVLWDRQGNTLEGGSDPRSPVGRAGVLLLPVQAPWRRCPAHSPRGVSMRVERDAGRWKSLGRLHWTVPRFHCRVRSPIMVATGARSRPGEPRHPASP